MKWLTFTIWLVIQMSIVVELSVRIFRHGMHAESIALGGIALTGVLYMACDDLLKCFGYRNCVEPIEERL